MVCVYMFWHEKSSIGWAIECHFHYLDSRLSPGLRSYQNIVNIINGLVHPTHELEGPTAAKMVEQASEAIF